MSFTPIIPAPGLAGWRFLQRTLDRQENAHGQTQTAQRDEAYFRERIGQVRTAEDLVSDRRLLRIALTAFGLADDLNNRAFLVRVLDSDTTDRRSFAGRLADKRYMEFAAAFGFKDPFGPRIARPGTSEVLLQRFREASFEVAVGQQDDNMRLALSLQRDLRRLAAQPGSDDARWFTILGTPSMRRVFEVAFGLPKEFASLDIDRQAEVLRSRTQRLTGSAEASQFADPARIDRLIDRFFVGAQLGEVRQVGRGTVALSLLEQIPRSRIGVAGR
jgi:hypothetical protein